jgi:cytochrome c oxidase cbb3-type subunit IV
MDVNLLRSAVTVVGLVVFIALVAWTWLPRRRATLDEAALVPFRGDPESRDE